MGRKIKIKKSEIDRIVNEAFSHTLNESDGNSSEIEKLCGDIDNRASEIQREYYSHERMMDRFWWGNSVGLDNVTVGFTYDYPYAADGNEDAQKEIEEDFENDYMYFAALKWIMNCEGFGPNAMARGFSASDPRSVIYVNSGFILKDMDKIGQLLGYDTKGLEDRGIQMARKWSSGRK